MPKNIHCLPRPAFGFGSNPKLLLDGKEVKGPLTPDVETRGKPPQVPLNLADKNRPELLVSSFDPRVFVIGDPQSHESFDLNLTEAKRLRDALTFWLENRS